MNPLCLYCKADRTVKNGRSAAGAQRYFCATCGKTFQVEPHKRCKVTLSLEEIKRLRSEGLSLAKIGKLAGISRERVRQLLL